MPKNRRNLPFFCAIPAYLILCLGIGVLFAGPPAHAQDDRAGKLLEAVVGIDARIPGTARTAASLGTMREGSGVVISDDGLVLTIGYLILEASEIDVVTGSGRKIPADFIGYDHDSGFGLVRALQDIDIAPVKLGSASDLTVRQQALVANRLGAQGAQGVYVVSRRPFVGAWEYLLEDAIYTSPPNPNFSGAGLFDADGSLLGIGSLFIGNAVSETQALPGNMFVPIDELKPILDDLIASGHRSGKTRPWIGVYTTELRGRVIVDRVAQGGPAAAAGIEPGDLILAVRNEPVTGMASLYRAVWKDAKAGDAVELRILDGAGQVREITIRSIDRRNWFKLNPTL